MTYFVKEIFKTLQGEGTHSGRPSVFCRFSGCNLWSGKELDRANANCKFCDTDFIGINGSNGGRYQDSESLADTISNIWGSNEKRKYVVFTGGEPLLQLDSKLIQEMHRRNFTVAVETNGTIKAPKGIDWLCVSPKGKNKLIIQEGDELKLVYPQLDAPPEIFSSLNFENFFIQPMDGPFLKDYTLKAIEYCLKNTQWNLSAQLHKYVGIA